MNPIVKNIALKLCESAPACVMEVLFETLIKTWNDYVREYNLPFNSIDILELKGITDGKKLPIPEKNLNNETAETDDDNSRICVEQVDEQTFFKYFLEQVERPHQSFDSNNEAQSSTWTKPEHLANSETDDCLREKDKLNQSRLNDEEVSIKDSSQMILIEVIGSLEHKFKTASSEHSKDASSHDEKRKLNIHKVNGEEIWKQAVDPLTNKTMSLVNWFGVSDGEEGKVLDSEKEKRKEEEDDDEIKKTPSLPENKNMNSFSTDICGQSLKSDFQNLKQPKEAQISQYDACLEKEVTALIENLEEKNDSLEYLIKLSPMKSVSGDHAPTTSEVFKNIGEKHESSTTGKNKLLINVPQESRQNFNHSVKGIPYPDFNINGDSDLIKLKEEEFGKGLTEAKEDRLLFQLPPKENSVNKGPEENIKKQTNDNKLNSMSINDEMSHLKEAIITDDLSDLNEMKYHKNKMLPVKRIHFKKDDTISRNFHCKNNGFTVNSSNSDLQIEYNNRSEKSDIDSDDLSLNLISRMKSDQEGISERTEGKQCAENISEGKESLSCIRKETEIDKEMKKKINENYNNSSKSATQIKMDLKELEEFVKIPQVPPCQLRCKESAVDINAGKVVSQIDNSNEQSATTHSVMKNKSTHNSDRRKTEDNISNKMDSMQTGFQKKMLRKHMTKTDEKIFQDSFSGDGKNVPETGILDENGNIKCSSNSKNALSMEQKSKDNADDVIELERQHCNQQNGVENKARSLFNGNKFKHISDNKMVHEAEIHPNSTREKKCVPRLPRPPSKIHNSAVNKTFSKYSLRADDYTAKKTCKESVQMGSRCNKNLNPCNNKNMIFGKCSECEEIQSKKTFGENHNSRRTLTKDSHPHVYYKDRRHRSKSKSVDRAKRKQNSNLSKKSAKPATKRVTFVEDNSIFSYDPDDSIVETFYHGRVTEKKKKERDVGKENNAQLDVKMNGRKENIKEYITLDVCERNTKMAYGEESSEIKKSDAIDNAAIEEKSSYINLAFNEDDLPDCPLEIEPIISIHTNSMFEENEHLLNEKKSVTNTKSKTVPGKFSEFKRQTECNAKRWLRDNLLAQKRVSFKKMKSMMKR